MRERSVSRTSIGIRWAVALLPFVGYKIQSVPAMWPPIGSLAIYGASSAAALTGAFGKLPSIFETKATAKKAALCAFAIALFALIAYGFLLSKFVKGVETPNNGVQYRTIGSQRTIEALQIFPGQSDEEILEKAGLNEGDIERMWTPSSVEHAQFGLFISYLVLLGSFNFAVGSYSRASARRAPPR